MNYRLNPTSKITKGFSRSIIIDLEKELFYLIPNAMADIFTQYPFGDQIDMLSKFKEIKVKNIVKEYFDFKKITLKMRCFFMVLYVFC